MIDLTAKRFTIFGIQGSGKTVLAKFLIKPYNSYFIYDTLHEYKGLGSTKQKVVYKPSHATTGKAINEFNYVINKAVIPLKPTVFLIDEMNRFCPNRKPMPEAMQKLSDWHRHYNIGFGGIARRPTDVNTSLVELSHYIFLFGLQGKNDYRYMNDLVDGLGDAVRALDPFHFIMVKPDRTFELMNPVVCNETD